MELQYFFLVMLVLSHWFVYKLGESKGFYRGRGYEMDRTGRHRGGNRGHYKHSDDNVGKDPSCTFLERKDGKERPIRAFKNIGTKNNGRNRRHGRGNYKGTQMSKDRISSR